MRLISRIVHSKFIHTSRCFASKIPVTLIPGDGTGPDRMKCMENIAKVAGLNIDWKIHHLSERDPYISENIDDVAASIMSTKYCIKGPIASVEDSNSDEALVMKIRKKLDTYISQIHFKTISTKIPAHFKDIDIVLFRESTEGEYSNIEHEASQGTIECLKIVSKQNSMRIAKKALDFAVANNRKKITVVHKANIMKKTDGLFIKCAKDVKASDKKYENIEMNFLIVDNCSMQLPTHPEQFDVILTSNLYGNILANIIAGLMGGPSLIAGKLSSDSIKIHEAGLRKTYSEASGRNIANPTAEILALSNLLVDLKMDKEGALIKEAVKKVFDNHDEARTMDLGGTATTSRFMEYLTPIVENLFSKNI